MSFIMALQPSAHAQLKGDRIPGAIGLQSGTQAPPGLYVANLAYVYQTDTIKDNNGNTIAAGANLHLTTALEGVAFSWVTNGRFLGANIGGQLMLPFVHNRIQTNSLSPSASFGLTDIYLQPLALGWHRSRADFTAGYGIYFPAGSYVSGGSDNHGLGMYGQELSAGATLYLNQAKQWHLAALMSYEFHTPKRGADQTVGQIMTIEGGIGRTFLKKTTFPVPTIMNLGVAGYTQFKTTSDSGSGVPPILLGLTDQVAAVGPEFNVLFPKQGFTLAVRYMPEFGAQLRTQGQSFSVTLAYVAKSLAREPAR